jgi:hypothetical protein
VTKIKVSECFFFQMTNGKMMTDIFCSLSGCSHSQDALIVRSLSFFNFRFIETDDGTSLNRVGTSSVEVAI